MNATFFKKVTTALALSALALPVFAASQTFDLTWSGASFGNTATATGEITFDPAQLETYNQFYFPSAVVTSASITIQGAQSGNGTFDASNFDFVVIELANGLDFSKQLVGQSLADGSTWGTSTGDGGNGAGGDFNFFSNHDSDAPYGTWYFTLSTADGSGDPMLLTSMTAATAAVPEAQASAMLLAGLGLVGVIARRRKTPA